MVGVMSPEVFDGDAVLFREGEQCFGGFFRHEGQVDVFSGEGALVGAAEQEQCFGEVDRPGVDGVEAVDEFAGVPARIGAGDVEECLRDRQRGPQLVRGVGRESLLFGDVRFEPREHHVEGVGEFAELVFAARQPDSMGERSVRGHACGVRDPGQRGEHPAGEDPPSHEAEHQQERQYRGRPRSENVQEAGPDGENTVRGVVVGIDERRALGDVTQEERPHRREQQGTREHEESGVAEGEFEANAQPGSLSTISSLMSSVVPGLRWRVDAIADAWHGGDDPGFAEPFAQCRDGDAYGVGERVGVLIPRPLQQLFGADDTAFGSDEDFEHRELLPGQRDIAAVPEDLSAERVQPQTCDLSHGRPVVGTSAVECSEPQRRVPGVRRVS